MKDPVHIVAQFSGIGGTEMHASTLARMLGPLRPAILWSDTPTGLAAHFGANNMQPFAGRMPRGGTLVILGAHTLLGPWLDHVRPRRLIVIHDRPQPGRLFATLARLERPSLPTAELVFASERLRQSAGLPGRISPPLVDTDLFRPGPGTAARPATVGRHSRDAQEKHHPGDLSLYRMLAWRGYPVRLMGASCLAAGSASQPEIEILAAGSRPAQEFLAGLDVFFYRTDPRFGQGAGRAAMEALACGLPVVAGEGGAHDDWIDSGRNGFIVRTQEEAFERLQQLLARPAERLEMGLAARETAQKIAGHETRHPYLEWLSA